MARITTSGQITEFPLPAGSVLGSLTAGPDANLWFTESWFTEEGPPSRVARITSGGQITEFPLPARTWARTITSGPDGNLWFTAHKMIGRITPLGQLTEYHLTQGGEPSGITSGPDGNLWFTQEEMIGRITPLGQVAEFRLPNEEGIANAITVGADGNIWYSGGIPEGEGLLGRIATDGQITQFHLPSLSWGITAGPDGNVWYMASSYCKGPEGFCKWFEEPVPSRIGRITPGLLAIEIADERVTVHKGRTKLKLGCAGHRHSTCRGRISLSLDVGRHKIIPVADVPYSFPSGRYYAVLLRLNPKALRLIFRNYPLLAGLQATATVRGGRGASREVTLESKSWHLDRGSLGTFPSTRLG